VRHLRRKNIFSLSTYIFHLSRVGALSFQFQRSYTGILFIKFKPLKTHKSQFITCIISKCVMILNRVIDILLQRLEFSNKLISWDQFNSTMFLTGIQQYLHHLHNPKVQASGFFQKPPHWKITL